MLYDNTTLSITSAYIQVVIKKNNNILRNKGK